MTKTISADGLLQINEQIEDWHSEDLLIDQKNHLIKNIALTGMKSKNGYQYSEKALKEALGLYENKPVFLDHASNLAKPYDRSTRDLVGSVVNARFERNRVRGDIRILETEAGKTFIALVQSNTPSVGMSQVVMGERGKDASLIEKIHDVVSVDAVIFPATTTTFREQLQNGQQSSQQKKDERHKSEQEKNSVTEKQDESLKLIQEKVQKLEEEIKKYHQLKEELVSQLSQLEEENHDLNLQVWIYEQEIPEALMTDTFQEQLTNVATDEERQVLLDERLMISKIFVKKPPTSSERYSPLTEGSISDDSIVSIIKRA